MNIESFKKGDIITRTEPSLAIFGGMSGIFGGKTELHGDRSYMGDQLKFLGIANNHIYFQSLDEVSILSFGKDRIFDLAVDAWNEGWELYIDPKSLLEENQPIVTLSKKQLEDKLQKAINNEDYELAEKLKIQLNNL